MNIKNIFLPQINLENHSILGEKFIDRNNCEYIVTDYNIAK